jgi:hypothetical protein
MSPASTEYGYGGFLAEYDAVEDGHVCVWTLVLAAVPLTLLERAARRAIGEFSSRRGAKAKEE